MVTRCERGEITAAVRQAAEHGEDVKSERLQAGWPVLQDELVAQIALVRADLTRRMLGVAGLVVAAFRLLG